MITVETVEGGLASRYIHDTWQVGTRVTTSAPLGDFTYEPLRDAKTVVGVAGGSGITPFLSMARAIAEGDEDAELILLYGNRTLETALFCEELEALVAGCPKLRLIHVLSHEERAGCEHGFIDAKLIQKYAPTREYSVFLCGPRAMYEFADGELPKLGLRPKFIRRELFGECFLPGNDQTWQLTVRIAGREQTVRGRADESILRTLEKNGIAAPARCRSGQCGWCHSRLVSGQVYVIPDVDGRREADKLYGYIHPCCSFPLSDLTVEVPPMKA